MSTKLFLSSEQRPVGETGAQGNSQTKKRNQMNGTHVQNTTKLFTAALTSLQKPSSSFLQTYKVTSALSR